LVLRLNQETDNRFEAKPGETVATSFEAKLEKTVAASFEAKSLETVATGFEAKPAKTVRVVLRPNHSQIVDLGFEAQPRNPRSSCPRARCIPHTAPPDLSIAWPPSTRPVRPSLTLCTMSPTPSTVLIAACHVSPATCTPQDKQTRFSKRKKGKRKIKQNYPGFEFKPRQVNGSSQSNQGTYHLVSQLRPHIDVHDAYQIRFGCSTYARKEDMIKLPMALVQGLTKIRFDQNC
jgi:hypothetical protein